jgi:hypothetical protein
VHPPSAGSGRVGGSLRVFRQFLWLEAGSGKMAFSCPAHQRVTPTVGQPIVSRRQMNNQEGLEFIRKYFDELFGKQNMNALDVYLDKDYFDDDIADLTVDHIKNSKEFIAELFRERPTIGVDVKEAITRDDVISAFIEWFVDENNVKRTIGKGIAIFVVKNRKILKSFWGKPISLAYLGLVWISLSMASWSFSKVERIR